MKKERDLEYRYTDTVTDIDRGTDFVVRESLI